MNLCNICLTTLDMPWLENQLLFTNQLEWIPLLILGYLIGYIVAKAIGQPTISLK